ncbi:hypothetical protein DYB36_010191 [Aphanomyces astaci]|uniref:DDE-1 domain-containing protein n=1 Tax=Aphanomyces astaci TaxID=112090 RepID=A0A397BAB6_APHAT|nr:hypothetical protein DYB36_010191 [Aphanomyces astaci]
MENGIPRGTWTTWLTLRAKLTAATRNSKRTTLDEQGAKGIILFQHVSLTFMKNVHRDEYILTSMHIINFMRTYQKAWLDTYVEGKVEHYKSLLRLWQSFAARHRFSQRVPCHTKLPEISMVLIRNDFAATFWNTYSDRNLRDIINADETAVSYDMPPARYGRKSGSRPSVLEPLPPNCTSVCQSLDVGVMGPFKKLLSTLWLEETTVCTAAEKRLTMIKKSFHVFWKASVAREISVAEASAATTAAQATLEEEQVARMTSLGRKFEESLRVTHETRVALEEQVSTMSAHDHNLQDLLRVAQDKAHLAHVLESTDHSSASRLKR